VKMFLPCKQDKLLFELELKVSSTCPRAGVDGFLLSLTPSRRPKPARG
jgi:hypothetical protein